MSKRLLLLLIGLIVVLVGCYVAPVRETPLPTAEWVPVTIRATGSGAPPPSATSPAQARLMTERAARLDAYRNLLEQAYGVQITSHSTVKDFVLQNDTIRSRVEAFIKGARVVDTRHLSDGSVEVEMELTLGYEFRQFFPQ